MLQIYANQTMCLQQINVRFSSSYFRSLSFPFFSFIIFIFQPGKCVHASFIVQCQTLHSAQCLHIVAYKVVGEITCFCGLFLQGFLFIVCIKPTIESQKKKRLTGSGIVSNVCRRHRSSVSFGKY